MQTTLSTLAVPLLDVSRDNKPLRDQLIEAFTAVLDSGQYIGGPDCQLLEQLMAQHCGTKFAVGCASGSDALLLALMAAGIGPGDEVIVPSFTFFATASAVARLGAKPVFGDIDAATFNLNPQCLEELVTARTKAIIPVHLFGQCCDLEPILQLASARGLKVIEDCAQSIGATYRGRSSGGLGHIGCYSFYPTKNLGGFGDGGLITTDDPDLADRIRLLANHGMRPRYHHQEIGINSRLDSIQAALLAVKLRHIGRWTQLRQQNAQRYQQLILESGLRDLIVAPAVHPNCNHVWNQFTIRIPGGQRDAVRQKLAAEKIGTEIYYPIPLHRQVCFAYLGYEKGSLPQTERACNEVLSLPIFPELTGEEQTSVIETLAAVMQVSESGRRVA